MREQERRGGTRVRREENHDQLQEKEKINNKSNQGDDDETQKPTAEVKGKMSRIQEVIEAIGRFVVELNELLE